MKVYDKVFIVTGGANGLGLNITLQLLEKGASVAVVDKDESALEKLNTNTARKCSGKLSTHLLDIREKAQIEQLPDKILQSHNVIDGLINNAGIIQPFERVNDLDYSSVDKVMQTNFFGTLFMTKTFLPILLKRPEAHIVNVSSMGGFFPVPGQTVYGASKAAVKLFTEGLHSELIDTNVHVTLVLPGSMDTEIMKNSGVEMNPKMRDMQKNVKVLSAEKAADIVIRGIEKGHSRILVGTDSWLMNILYRAFPQFAPRAFCGYMGDMLMD